MAYAFLILFTEGAGMAKTQVARMNEAWSQQESMIAGHKYHAVNEFGLSACGSMLDQKTTKPAGRVAEGRLCHRPACWKILNRWALG